jgi:hypothetical protein
MRRINIRGNGAISGARSRSLTELDRPMTEFGQDRTFDHSVRAREHGWSNRDADRASLPHRLSR